MTQQEQTDIIKYAQESFTTLDVLKNEQKVIKLYIDEECERDSDYSASKETITEERKKMKAIKTRIMNCNNSKTKRLLELKEELKLEREVFDTLAVSAVKADVQLVLFDEAQINHNIELVAKIV